MAWQWCWPEHSLHVTVTMQILELEVTTTIHMNHGKCNDELQIQDLLSDYGKYCEYESHTLTGSGDTNSGTKWADLTLQVSNIGWNCDIVNVLCLRHSIKLSLSLIAHLVSKNVTLYLSVLPRLPRGILGLPLLHRLAQPSQEGLLVPSKNRSFSDKSIQTLILHRRCPLWTGISAFMEWSHLDKSLGMQVLLGPANKLHITVLDVPWCFSGQIPSSPCDNIHYNPVTGSPLLHSQVVSQLPKSWLFTGNISAKVYGFTVGIWSQTLGSLPLVADVGAVQTAQV